MPHARRFAPLPGSIVLVLLLFFLAGTCAEPPPSKPCPRPWVGVIEGYVRVAGEPVQATVARLFSAAGDGPAIAYVARSLPDGDWKVGAWKTDWYAPEAPPDGTFWYPGTADWDSAGVIAIREHEDVEGIDWVMPES